MREFICREANLIALGNKRSITSCISQGEQVGLSLLLRNEGYALDGLILPKPNRFIKRG